ncbi:carbohydrate ABC transporter membrane protein 1 (CUT1 family) [Murinocardiopsis flavida]|uniref:Carbohydrate ABC transporter membrane protein 1 (CUT1 family) n=1 Tax=Murinocardiopsis flavida TaxID=645275 RepID=A0A2P8DFL9_9ACTN|nr:sugar ABC transporter permease [Murinocardiopsis flavida]PSK96011.1 carbohydrate ABC transporter membrane protein 1 (CUT1 family) [Murinocardiopsis flavida]
MARTHAPPAPAPTAAAPRALPLRRRPAVIALGFLAPALLMLVVLRLWPAAQALYGSLLHTSLLEGTTTWVGLDNYAVLFTDPDFWQSVGVTLVFNLVINPGQVLIALGLAVLFAKRFAGARLWRSLVLIPVAVPPAVSAVIWGVLYRPEGPLNALLAVFGLPAQPYLTSPAQALGAMIVMMSWVGVGYWMMFLLAGLQDIPADLYEAAKIDGASAWRRFVHVTLPQLRRPLAFVLVADTISNFLVFAPVQLLTSGGPEGATKLMMFDIFHRAYSVGDLHLALAEVMILVLVTLVIVSVQFRLLHSRED